MSESDEVRHKVEALEDRVQDLEKAVEELYPFMEEEARLRLLALECVLQELPRHLSPGTQHAFNVALHKRTASWIHTVEELSNPRTARMFAEKVSKLVEGTGMRLGDI